MRQDDELAAGETFTAVEELPAGDHSLESPEQTVPEGERAEETEASGESLERYLREVSRWGLLSAEAERDLARRISKGDPRALEELITRNLRLVVYWAKRYRSSGLPIQDLIQEGNIGLMRAAEKFDPRKGTRFSTYASWWIRQALARAICDKQDLIRIPVHMHQKMRRVDRLLESRGAADAPGVDVEATVERSGIVPFKEWESARRLQQPLSLDRRQDPDREGPIEVEDTTSINPMREVYLREIKEHVSRLLEDLPPRHQAVLRLRYGLDGGKEYTLEAIGARLRISRERVRQIQTEAIERIAEITGLPKPRPPVTRRTVAGPEARIEMVAPRRARAARPVRSSARRRQASPRPSRVAPRRRAV